jgi:outer membrane protein
MVMEMWSRSWLAALALAMPVWAFAQTEPLSVLEAVRLARERNGTIRAAQYEVQASRSRVAQAFSDFLPTVIPQFSWTNSRVAANGFSTSRGTESIGEINAQWRLLDAGQRSLSYRSARQSAFSFEADAVQTLRETLYTVHQQFFDALRAQELLRVNEASVERADEILKATDAQIEVGAAPKKDRLQAVADVANARYNLLTARNFASNSLANLKATIGWDRTADFPTLQNVTEAPNLEPLPPLAQVVTESVARREDLRSRRFSIEASRLNAERIEREAGITWSLDANYGLEFNGAETDSRRLTFLVSYPLFDGNLRREAAREARLNVQAQRANYTQFERAAISEIESAYLELQQNRERLDAARVALEAARLNYEAASESQRLGAEGTNIISVLTAKISLVTAESNYVEAIYDLYISDVLFRLVTGQPIPGESS